MKSLAEEKDLLIFFYRKDTRAQLENFKRGLHTFINSISVICRSRDFRQTSH